MERAEEERREAARLVKRLGGAVLVGAGVALPVLSVLVREGALGLLLVPTYTTWRWHRERARHTAADDLSPQYSTVLAVVWAGWCWLLLGARYLFGGPTPGTPVRFFLSAGSARPGLLATWAIPAAVVLAVSWLRAHWRGLSGPARFVCVAGGLYLAARYYHFLNVLEVPPSATSDTSVYVRLAGLPLRDPRFWVGSRPFAAPLVWKLAGDDPARIAAVQAALGTVAWAVLAWSVARAMRPPMLRYTAAAVVLYIGADGAIAAWDNVLLSESVSISLFALSLAAGLAFVLRPSRPALGALLVTVFFWTFARDTNAYVVLGMAAITAGAGLASARRRRYLGVAVGLVLIAGASYAASSRAMRWTFPFQNVLAMRILPDAERTAFFRDRGMPVDDALMRRAGKYAAADDYAFYKDPQLADYRAWLHRDGKRTYAQFLLSRPGWTLAQPVRLLDDVLTPRLGAGALFRVPVLAYALTLVLVAGAVVAMMRVTGRRALFLLALAVVLTNYAQAFVVYHGDAMELARRGVPVAIQYRLGFWLLALALGDAAFAPVVPPELDADAAAARQSATVSGA